MAYFDTETNKLYQNGYVDDPFMGEMTLEQNNIVYIDDLMAPVIQLLNKKGYKTAFCCSDHALTDAIVVPKDENKCEIDTAEIESEPIHDAYISFDGVYDLGNLPDGWVYDRPENPYFTVIRYGWRFNDDGSVKSAPSYIPIIDDENDNIDGNEYFNSYRIIIDIIEKLYNYVKTLPNNDMMEKPSKIK